MNPDTVAILVTLGIQSLGAVYYFGRLAQRLENVESRLEKLEALVLYGQAARGIAAGMGTR